MARVVTARKQSSVNKLTRQSSVHSLMKAEDEREGSNSRSFTARSSRFEGGRSSTYSNLTKSKLSQKFQNRMKELSKRARVAAMTMASSQTHFEAFQKEDTKPLRKGIMHRGIMDTSYAVWEPQHLMLTSERLFIAYTKPNNEDTRLGLLRHGAAFSPDDSFNASGNRHGIVFDDILLRDVIECEIKRDNEDPADMLQVIFRTEDGGYNAGRSYIFRSEREDAEAWDAEVDAAVADAKTRFFHECLKQEFGHSCVAMLRERSKIVYESRGLQSLVAVMIVMGFISDVIEAQMQPSPDSRAREIFLWLELGVTGFYTLELLANAFVHSAHCFQEFYSEKQNWIDAGVVLASIASLVLQMLDTANAIPIKMIRVVRVLNLSKFMKELSAMQRMVTCLSYCVIPMANAFVLLLILTIIYAVLGAQIFQEKAPEFFGDFQASLFTLFQVLSGDSWASQIARGMMVDDQGHSLTEPALALFFISYFILANIVLLNVVVAVLLDEFVANVVREHDHAQAVMEKENAKRRITGVLDCITEKLSGFESAQNFTERIDSLYQRLDQDKSGGLNYDEFRRGLRNLDGIPAIHLTEFDFARLTNHGQHLSAEQELTALKFRDMMKDEFWRYSQRQLANNLNESTSKEFKSTVLMLKMLETRLLEAISADRKQLLALVAAQGDGVKGTGVEDGGTEDGDAVKMVVGGVEEMERVCQRVVFEAMESLERKVESRFERLEQRLMQQLRGMEGAGVRVDNPKVGSHKRSSSWLTEAEHIALAPDGLPGQLDGGGGEAL